MNDKKKNPLEITLAKGVDTKVQSLAEMGTALGLSIERMKEMGEQNRKAVDDISNEHGEDDNSHVRVAEIARRMSQISTTPNELFMHAMAIGVALKAIEQMKLERALMNLLGRPIKSEFGVTPERHHDD